MAESEAFKVLSLKYGAKYTVDGDFALTTLTYNSEEIGRLVADLNEVERLRGEIANLKRTVAVLSRKMDTLLEKEEEYDKLISYSQILLREILEKFKGAPYTEDLGMELMESFSQKIWEHQMWAETKIAEVEDLKKQLKAAKTLILEIVDRQELSNPTESGYAATKYITREKLHSLLVDIGWLEIPKQ